MKKYDSAKIEEQVNTSEVEVRAEPVAEPIEPSGPFVIKVEDNLNSLLRVLENFKPGEIIDKIVVSSRTRRGVRGKSDFLVIGRKILNDRTTYRVILSKGVEQLNGELMKMVPGEQVVEILDEPVTNRVKGVIPSYYLAIIKKS